MIEVKKEVEVRTRVRSVEETLKALSEAFTDNHVKTISLCLTWSNRKNRKEGDKLDYYFTCCKCGGLVSFQKLIDGYPVERRKERAYNTFSEWRDAIREQLLADEYWWIEPYDY